MNKEVGSINISTGVYSNTSFSECLCSQLCKETTRDISSGLRELDDLNTFVFVLLINHFPEIEPALQEPAVFARSRLGSNCRALIVKEPTGSAVAVSVPRSFSLTCVVQNVCGSARFHLLFNRSFFRFSNCGWKQRQADYW